MAKKSAENTQPQVEVNLDELKEVLDEVFEATGGFAVDGIELNLRTGDIFIHAVYSPPDWKITMRTEAFTLK